MLKTTFDPELRPPHPGEVLREDILPSLAMTRAALAQHLEISVRMLSDLINERRPVTFDLAQRLGVALGSGTRYWLALQAQHDIWRAAYAEPLRVRPLVWGKRSAPLVRQVVTRSSVASRVD